LPISPPNTPGLERREDGQIKFSFVNLMAFHRPLVIVDEAHKAGTNLSFDMLAALRPSCIVEFTATPKRRPAQRQQRPVPRFCRRSQSGGND
jgi:restriction endonuclease